MSSASRGDIHSGQDSPAIRDKIQSKEAKFKRPRFEEIEEMEQNEEGARRQQELARQEFSRRKAGLTKNKLEKMNLQSDASIKKTGPISLASSKEKKKRDGL